MAEKSKSPMTYTVNETGGVKAHRLVKFNTAANRQVSYAGAAEEKDVIGVTMHDADDGKPVTIQSIKEPGTFIVTADAAVTAGAELVTAASGKVSPIAAETVRIGIAVAAASGDNSEFEAFLSRMSDV